MNFKNVVVLLAVNDHNTSSVEGRVGCYWLKKFKGNQKILSRTLTHFKRLVELISNLHMLN